MPYPTYQTVDAAGNNSNSLVYNSTPPSLTNGQEVQPQADASGNMMVNVAAGGSAAFVDEAAFTAGTTGTNVVAGFYESSPSTLTSGHAGAIGLDSKRNVRVVGNVASGSADSGAPVKVGGVFNSSLPTIASANRVDLQLDSRTNLKVNPHAAPLIIQKTNGVTGSGGKTLAQAFGSNNVAGNSIVVVVGAGNWAASNWSLAITDSNNNTYSQAALVNESTTQVAAIFYATGIVGGANTVTATLSGSNSSNTAIAIEIYEVAGLMSLVTPVDGTATAANAGSTSPSAGSVTPTSTNEWAFTAIAAAGGTITAGTNWTLDSGTLSPTGGNLVSFGSQSLFVINNQSAVTGSATLSGSNAWAAALATFKGGQLTIGGNVNSNLATLIAGEDLANNRLDVEQHFSYAGYTTAQTATTVKSGAGFLHTITIAGGTAGAITIWDNTAGSGTTIIGAFTPGNVTVPVTLTLNVAFATGLTFTTAAATVITFSYR